MKLIHYNELNYDLARAGCFVLDMPNEAYHAYDGISKSGLDIINRSPAHYFFNSYSEPSPAMLMGTAVHTAILEPERFKDVYLILDVKDRKASAYKEAVKARGVERVLLKKDYERIATMQEVIAADNEASELLDGCDLFEVSAFVGIPDTDIILRCRYDAFNTREGVAVDLQLFLEEPREVDGLLGGVEVGVRLNFGGGFDGELDGVGVHQFIFRSR